MIRSTVIRSTLARGKVSSSSLSGAGIGLLKSTDGGDTWKLIDFPQFVGHTVAGIVILPDSSSLYNNMLVATLDKPTWQ